MELELKHLAPYLPYRVEIYQLNADFRNTFTLDIEGLRIMEVQGFKYFKPILRPLSDYKKEIYINGQIINPFEYLVHNTQSIIGLNLMGIKMAYGNDSIPLFDANKLFEWHFDIYGLIAADLALDVNSLNVD